MKYHPAIRHPFRLIKAFGRHDWASEFLSGDLYMNTLGFFWGQGNSEQSDCLEGVCASLSPCDMNVFDREFCDIQAYEAKVIPAGFEYCNVLCFSMQTMRIGAGGAVVAEGPSLENGLGENLVVLDDPLEFVSRVLHAARTLKFEAVMGPVEYYGEEPLRATKHHILLRGDPVDPAQLTAVNNLEFSADAFCKFERYSAQREWRIALYRSTKEVEAYRLKIGDLHGIAHEVSKADFDDDTRKSAENALAWLSPKGHVGTCTREELRRLFFQLGDGKVCPLLAIG